MPLSRLFAVLCLLITSTASAVKLQLPSGHPRLWFGNATCLVHAQAHFATTLFTPAGGDIQFKRALRRLRTTNNADCNAAGAHVNGWLVENQGSIRDALCQQGEELLAIYDWCHQRLTPAQTAEVITLLPAPPSFRVVDEDMPGDEQARQLRLELDSIGSTESYFPNVVTGYDAGEASLHASLTDNGASRTLALSHPTRGDVSLTLAKGKTFSGGSLSIGAATTPLRDDVRGISVSSGRPLWANAGALFDDGFEATTRRP